MRSWTANGLNRAFWTLTGLAAVSSLVEVATYTIAGCPAPNRSLVGLSAAAVIVAALSGATVTRFWAARRGGGRALPSEVAAMQDPLTLTSAQARRLSRRFELAGVRITPSRLRAISAGVEAFDTELIDIEFALIATRPDHYALWRSDFKRRA